MLGAKSSLAEYGKLNHTTLILHKLIYSVQCLQMEEGNEQLASGPVPTMCCFEHCNQTSMSSLRVVLGMRMPLLCWGLVQCSMTHLHPYRLCKL